MNPVQKKVYELNKALYKRMCTLDDQQKEIKHLRSELNTKEKAIKALITAADDAEMYEKYIMNLRYINDELEYQIWSKNNCIIKLRQTISDLEGHVLSKDKEEKQCTVLKEQSIHKPVDKLQHEDKNGSKGVKQPVCGTTHLYSKADRQGARPDLEAAHKGAITAHKDTRIECSDRTSPPAIPTHRNRNR
jgi:chromosome segregation ATPase